jgi:hypothetical protein
LIVQKFRIIVASNVKDRPQAGFHKNRGLSVSVFFSGDAPDTPFPQPRKKIGEKMRRRQNRVEFRLDDQELARFNRAVERSELSQTAYIRHLINNRIPQDRPPPEYFEVLKELRMIGRNINQIALVANATGIIDAEKYDERHKELIRLILKIIETAEMPREVR